MNVQRGGRGGRDGGSAEAAAGTVGKALDVLDRVAAFDRPVRFADLLEDSPFPKATLYRLVQTLTREGMLSYEAAEGTYAPGLRLLRMAHSAWARCSLAPLARPHLDALSRDVGEVVHLAQLDGGHVLYVDKRGAGAPGAMFSEAGKVGPAYCTGVGKAMLAHLPPKALDAALARQSWHRFTPATIADPEAMRAELAAVRAAGHALDREEHEAGISCVAMPVLSAGGRLLGAVSVTTVAGGADGVARYLPRLRETVAAIEGEARARGLPEPGKD